MSFSGESDTGGATLPPLRQRIMRAMLLSSGEIGYRRVSPAAVCERFGGSPQQFFSEFADEADCFAAAYAFEAERLRRRLSSCIEGDEPCTVRTEAAIAELTELAATEPEIAKALFVEVHIAGGEPLRTQRLLLRRLARSIEGSCGEGATGTTPSVTAEFVVGVVEQAFSSSLAKERMEELREATPELAVVLSRFYSEAAG